MSSSVLAAPDEAAPPASSLYRTVWRWHFYAGLLVLPFLILLAVTGGLYLFKDEINGVIYRAYLTVTPADTLKQAQAERAVQEQQFRVLVDETVRRAKGLLATDPDSAYEDLKRQRDVVLSNAQLGEGYRQKLASDLEAAMQTISTKGAEIKRKAAEEREHDDEGDSAHTDSEAGWLPEFTSRAGPRRAASALRCGPGQ